MQPTVMIVDDEPEVRSTLFDFLDDYDEFHLLQAESAESALEQLRNEPADLCIVDMRLPGMNGRMFVKEASARGLCRFFLLHTGSIGVTLDEDLASIGLTEQDIFLKPCDNRMILDRIRTLVGG